MFDLGGGEGGEMEGDRWRDEEEQCEMGGASLGEQDGKGVFKVKQGTTRPNVELRCPRFLASSTSRFSPLCICLVSRQ